MWLTSKCWRSLWLVCVQKLYLTNLFCCLRCSSANHVFWSLDSYLPPCSFVWLVYSFSHFGSVGFQPFCGTTGYRDNRDWTCFVFIDAISTKLQLPPFFWLQMQTCTLVKDGCLVYIWLVALVVTSLPVSACAKKLHFCHFMQTTKMWWR